MQGACLRGKFQTFVRDEGTSLCQLVRTMKFRLFLTIALCFFSPISSWAADPYPWKAAAAKAKITPTENTWMAGYSARKGPAEGVLQDIHAKALAIEDADGGKFVFLTFDLIGIPKELRLKVEKLGKEKFGLEPSEILMNASHTHSGPMLRLFYPPGGGPPEASYAAVPEEEHELRVKQTLDYHEMLIGKITFLLEESLGNLKPAVIQWSEAKCGFAMNRRTPAGPGAWKNSPNPDGPVDHDVPVLQIRDQENQLKAVLFGYACHATTLSIMQYNGDWPGYAQTIFENEHPGTIALFLNGASADQNPYPRRMTPYVERHGRSMSTAIEAALQTPPVAVTGPIQAAIDWPQIHYQTPPTREQLEEKAKSTDKYDARHAEFLLSVMDSDAGLPKSYPVPVQVLRFGDSLSLAAIGGEVVVDYALRLKKELGEKTGGAPVWFSGYSNDVMTYIPSLRILEEGGYEGGGAMRYVRSTAHPAPWESDIEEKLVGKVHELFDGLKN